MYHSVAHKLYIRKGIRVEESLRKSRGGQMPIWTPFKCPKNQESSSGFHKGLTVEYTAVVCVTQTMMIQQPATRACRKALDLLLETGDPVPSYQLDSVQKNALPCLPCSLPAIHTPGIPAVPREKPVAGPG